MARAEAYLHLDTSNCLATIHQRHRQDRQWSDSTGQIVLQTVANKNFSLNTLQRAYVHSAEIGNTANLVRAGHANDM